MKYYIAPSILSADFARLGEEVNEVLQAGADLIHFDVMDNHYVPNLSFGPVVCQALRNYGITQAIDVHLMVTDVERLITDFAQAGATRISIHPETTHHLDRALRLIREHGCQAGIALNPTTPVNVLNYVLDQLDTVLIMSVNPGFGGQKFIDYCTKKITTVREMIKQTQCHCHIAVDGGVTLDNIGRLAQAGADTFIMGSAIFNTIDRHATLQQIRSILAAKA